MKVLGIGGSSHDFSATLLENGKIITAIEDERICRIKHGDKNWHSTPTKSSVEYCLQANNVGISEISHIFCNNDLELSRDYLPEHIVKHIPHHLAHASSAFYPSHFNEASILVIDGHGGPVSTTSDNFNLETISMGAGHGEKIELSCFQSGKKKLSAGTWHYLTENSLGSFYKVITDGIGFGMRGQGKTMGLAPYGDLSFLEELEEFVNIEKDGRFVFDPYSGIYDWIVKKLSSCKNKFQVRANIAAAAQKIFEDTIVLLANICYKKTGIKYLCYSGGCALNGVANYRIRKETPFEDVFIFPAAGDNGLSVGCAYYGYHHVLGHKRNMTPQSQIGKIAYCGKNYSQSECNEALNDFSVYYKLSKEPVKELRDHLLNKEVVALFQGRSEIGPRALGNRSIIADPRTSALRDHINLNIKHRESFRPLAPIVPVEAANDYFEIDMPTPFMLNIATVKKPYQNALAGICHVDGTARLQTIDKKTNPFLHELLYAYGEVSGFPILINTSFNSKGEPIVETPRDAINCFLNLDINILLLGDFVVEKHTPYAKRPQPIDFSVSK